MGAVVILALDPGARRRLSASRLAVSSLRQAREQLRAHGLEPALDLALALRAIGAGMDQRDAELGAHQRQVAGAVVGAVVDVQALRQAALLDRQLEHRQKGRVFSDRAKAACGITRVASSRKAIR
jgi:hypothetical protein